MVKERGLLCNMLNPNLTLKFSVTATTQMIHLLYFIRFLEKIKEISF